METDFDLDATEAAIERRLRHGEDEGPSDLRKLDKQDSLKAKKQIRKRRRVTPGVAAPSGIVGTSGRKAGSHMLGEDKDTNSARPTVRTATVGPQSERRVRSAESAAPAVGELSDVRASPVIVVAEPDRHIPQRYKYGAPDAGRRRGSTEERRAVEEAGEAAAFVEKHRYEVGAFGASGLDKRARRMYEESRAKALGIKVAKPQKMPLFILQGVRKKQKEREKKKKAVDLASGMLIRSKRRRVHKAGSAYRSRR